MKIINFLKNRLGTKKNNPDQLLKVFSHPRSGTHFLEAFIAENFYNQLDLKIDKVEWGHWSDRRINLNGNEYGKLFGNHYFPELNNNNSPKVYIYRDGRAVAYSVWKTDNFLHKKLENIDFNVFLHTQIDWYGTPSEKSNKKLNILQHWAQHVIAWKEFSKEKDNILLLKYEDLVNHPYDQYLKIKDQFFPSLPLKKETEFKIIKRPVGLLPNRASTDAWKQDFNGENSEYFQEIVKRYKLHEYENGFR